MIYINVDHTLFFEKNNLMLNRLNGPAVIDGEHKTWYIGGEEYTNYDYHNKLKEMGRE